MIESFKTPEDKALKMNLDSSIYGTFAEIGAGQEVANWFFRASATAGTVAKSISAYDMTISDALYGKSKRYVSQERVVDMVNYEYELLEKRLSETRGRESRFFCLCEYGKSKGVSGHRRVSWMVSDPFSGSARQTIWNGCSSRQSSR
ncbi:hypothetical protein N8634_00945 [bacterium]|nr:hypothetical protein [bacterium]